MCCGKYHKGKIHAPTAEALMRSRFSAYVLEEIQYVYRTWDKTTRPPLNVLREDSPQKFTKLEIIQSSKGSEKDNEGTVEFIASFILETNNSTKSDDTIHQHHENSYFQKSDKQWKYVNELSKVIKD